MKRDILFKLNDLENDLADLFVLEARGVLTADSDKEAERLKVAASATGLLVARIQWMFRNAVVGHKLPKMQPDQEDAKIIAEAERKSLELREAARKGVTVKVVNGKSY